jgi:ComF family protein
MFLTRAINQVYDSALALVYPQVCAVCGASVERRADGSACATCWQATVVFSGNEPICWKCGVLLKGKVTHEQRELIRCGHCDGEPFTAARSCGIYEKALRAAVLSLKSQPHVPRRLTGLLEEAAQRAPLDRAKKIIPVPLHPKRQRVRGFNQAEIIGSALARRSDRLLDPLSLFRVVHTELHRAGMDARARRETVEGAFAVRHPRLIADESILLVDDVFTTGATASACANALMNVGAKEVFVLTIARAPHY